MKNFALLPADARRALAMRELRRRGVTLATPETEEEWFQRSAPAAVAAFDRIEQLGAANGHRHERDWPADQREEFERQYRIALTAMKAAGDWPGTVWPATPEEEEARTWALIERMEATIAAREAAEQ